MKAPYINFMTLIPLSAALINKILFNSQMEKTQNFQHSKLGTAMWEAGLEAHFPNLER
jgi:hypothetical protein